MPSKNLLWLVSQAVVATTIVAAFFGTGFLLLTHPREEISATRSGVVATTSTPAATTEPAATATPTYSASPAKALPVSPRLFAGFAQAVANKGITFEQYRDARLRFLRQQQARLELQLTEPNLSAAQTRRLERQKAYWGRAIEETMASR